MIADFQDHGKIPDEKQIFTICIIILIIEHKNNSRQNITRKRLKYVKNDIHVLLEICIVDRPLSDWITDDIRALKIIRRKNEVNWRKNPLCIHFESFQESCMAVKHATDENKTQVIQNKITESIGDQKKIFNIVNTLLGRRKQLMLPDYNNSITLVSSFNMFLLIRLQTFVQSYHCLRAHYPLTRLSRWILLCLIVQFCLRILL